MEKKKYLTPEMRVRPVFTDESVLFDASFGKDEGTIIGDPFAKESNLNYNPEFKDVWAD